MEWPFYSLDFELLVDRFTNESLPRCYDPPTDLSTEEREAIMTDFLGYKANYWHFYALKHGDPEVLKPNQVHVLKNRTMVEIGDYFHYTRFKWLKENIRSYLTRIPPRLDFGSCRRAWDESRCNPYVLHAMDYLHTQINELPEDGSGGYYSSTPTFHSHLVEDKANAEMEYRMVRQIMVESNRNDDNSLQNLCLLQRDHPEIFHLLWQDPSRRPQFFASLET